MRALFLTTSYPSSSHPYAGIFVRRHALAAATAGVQTHVLHSQAAEGLRTPWLVVRERDDSLTEGLPTTRLLFRTSMVPGVSFATYLTGTVVALRTLRSAFRPDVIHSHFYAAGIPASVRGHGGRLPIVLTEHSSAPRGAITRVEMMKARFAYSHASRVLPVSRGLGDALVSRGLVRAFTVVPNAVDTSVFRPLGRPPTGGPLRLLYVGRLVPAKGLGRFLAALALVRDRLEWSLVVVGDGPAEGLFRAQALELRIQTHVRFVGRRRAAEIAQLLAEANLLVAPSIVENCSCAVLEALACGRPVLGTPTVQEFVGPADGVLASSPEPEHLAAALLEIAGQRTRFESAEITERAQAYSLESIGRALAAVYDNSVAVARQQ